MRFVLDPPAPAGLTELVQSAEHACSLGFDAVLCRATASMPASMVTAAAVLARVPLLRVVAEVPLGDRHPLLVAEEAAVVDVASAGRLILLIHPAPGADDCFFEAAALLRTALRARPFTFHGRRWSVPARLPENSGTEERYRLTPAPYQPRMEIWCAGVPAASALDHGFGHVAAENEPADQLANSAVRSDPLRADLARVRHDPWPESADRMLDRLEQGRALFGQDWSLVRAGADPAVEIARSVRPRIQLDRLPEGLAEFWSARAGQRADQD